MLRILLRSAVVSLALLGLAQAQTRELSSGGALLDRVAATVNDGIVLQSELDEQVEIISQRLRQQNLELPAQNVLRRQVLERLVLQEIQAQRAERAGIKVSDEMLNNALQDVAQRNGLTLSQLPAALADQGIDYSLYRESMRKEVMLTLLRQRDVLARINVTPREIDQFLERERRAPSETSEYNVSHILIAVPQAGTPSSSRKPKSGPQRCIGARRKVRISRSSRWPTPTARPPSKAVSSAGARDRSCRPSSPISS